MMMSISSRILLRGHVCDKPLSIRSTFASDSGVEYILVSNISPYVVRHPRVFVIVLQMELQTQND